MFAECAALVWAVLECRMGWRNTTHAKQLFAAVLVMHCNHVVASLGVEGTWCSRVDVTALSGARGIEHVRRLVPFVFFAR